MKIVNDFYLAFVSKLLATHFIHYPENWNFCIEKHGRLVTNELIESIPIYSRSEQTNDKEVILQNLLQVNSAYEALFFYLLQRQIFLEANDDPMLSYLARLMKLRTGAEIYYSTAIGKRLNIQHGVGIVIGPNNIIGDDCIVHQNVTIGQKKVFYKSTGAVIGNKVVIYAGAKIVGDIKIGDGVHIAANAVLTTDAESYSLYAGIPAIKIKSL